MKNQLTLLLCIFCMTLFSCKPEPCLTKKGFLYSFENFIDKVDEDYKTYEAKDWDKKDERFSEFVGTCYEKFEDKLSEAEKKDFWMQYLNYKVKRYGKGFFSDLSTESAEVTQELEEQIKKVLENPEENIKSLIKEVYGDDVDEAIDNTIKEISKFGDRLKEWLDE